MNGSRARVARVRCRRAGRAPRGGNARSDQGVLVYTQHNAALRQLGAGLRSGARRPRSLPDRLARFLLSVVPGSRRPAHHRVRHATQGADAVLRGARDAWIDRRLLSCSYLVGRKGGEAFLRKRFARAHVDRALAVFQKYGLLAVVGAVAPPAARPFKPFVLVAGVAGVRPFDFLLAVGIGRGVRYFGEGLLACGTASRPRCSCKNNARRSSLSLALRRWSLGSAGCLAGVGAAGCVPPYAVVN